MFSWQALALGVTNSDAGFVSIGIGHKGWEVAKYPTSIALHLANGTWFYRYGKPVVSKGKQAFPLFGQLFLLALSNSYSTRINDAVAISLPANPGIGEIPFGVSNNHADSIC